MQSPSPSPLTVLPSSDPSKPPKNTCTVMNTTYTFHTLRNNGDLNMMRQLIDLKNIFAKQLPKMPKEYIVRLIFDRKHESIVIKDPKNRIFGGICFRVFDVVSLAEIVFLAVMSERQIKGFGTRIMNQLKTQMQRRGVRFLMTCADNLAIGYFQKQGFHKEILMPPQLYKGGLFWPLRGFLIFIKVAEGVFPLLLTGLLGIAHSFTVKL